jgi:serine/threonine-protein kinase
MQLEQLGPYRLARRLGRGGMGTVFEGLNVDTAQPAAIKVLNPHLAVEEGFRERFEIEIETLKKLKHPNIVRLYGFGEQDGVIFYAMELVHGTNLEDELQAGRRFNWRETTSLGIKLARALQHAHDHGVIHRDLKPANLLLTPDNDLKLADFGIARLFGNTRLTSAGGLVGTAEYMAPEQADGRAITPQCDLYSLGGVLFAMLAGRPPFSGSSLPEILQLHRFAAPPSVLRFAPDVPGELADIIARLLSKDAAARGTNARVVGKQLSALEHALSMPRESGSTTTSPTATASSTASPSQPVRHEFELLPPAATTRPAQPPSDPFSTLPGHVTQPAAESRINALQTSESQQGNPEHSKPASGDPENGDLENSEQRPSWARMPVTLIPSPDGSSMAERATSSGSSAASPPFSAAFRGSLGVHGASAVPPYAGPRDPTAVADAPPSAPPAHRTGGQFDTAGASVLQPEARSAAPIPANRFITVEEDERRRAAADESARSSPWSQIALLSLALATLVVLGFLMLRPPSADALFARIDAAAGSGARPERLLDVEDDIHKFLARFPDDPRSAQLKGYAEEIELSRLERQMELRSRLAAGGSLDAPIEHDYAEATRDASNNPERAAAKLQALVDFYSQTPARSETTSRFLELSRRQLAHLLEQISQQTPAYLKLIDGNLSRADQLRTTDPAKARAIWSSIVELYAGKPWAADRVAKARAARNTVAPP